MRLCIEGAHLFNPASQADRICNVLVEDGIIASIQESGRGGNGKKADLTIDARGKYLFPGFIDMHVHLRDPGQTHKEDIESGTRAAAAGGFTEILAMPNVKPPADNPEILRDVESRADQAGFCRVHQVGAITKGMKGEELSDLEEMQKAGMIAVSEDGKSVMNSALVRHAMQFLRPYGIPILAHCEDIRLVEGGVMNAGRRAKQLGLPGITNAVENIIEARDIMLAEETGAKLHLCHCSTKESAEMLRIAKKKGIAVTGEVCPHHFLLTEDDIPGAEDANYKMNPPLRTEEDRKALAAGLSDGTFDVISTDHAPHTKEEKAGGFLNAPFGIVGLETSAALVYTELVKKNILTPMQMAEKMSANPARILGLMSGDVSVGKRADLTLFDPNETYRISPEEFVGKGKNMPYGGRQVTGRVVLTVCGGKITYSRR